MNLEFRLTKILMIPDTNVVKDATMAKVASLLGKVKSNLQKRSFNTAPNAEASAIAQENAKSNTGQITN